MRDRELYARMIGVEKPWSVTHIRLDETARRVEVEISFDGPATCPECGELCSLYDRRERRWRHLDTMQFGTYLVAEVPRVDCGTHGVRQVKVPWSEPGGRFTALFEAVVIDWLKEASITAVARLMSLSWAEVDGIMQRAVARGLGRRRVEIPARLGIDETSFRKRHDYVTVISAGHRVLHVVDGRSKRDVESFFGGLTQAQRDGIEVVAMDMWQPFIQAVTTALPEGASKIAYDKFHVAKHLGDAVDRVRRGEQRELRADGKDILTGTRYLWLTNEWSAKQQEMFAALRGSHLRTARAWALKQLAMALWVRSHRYQLERAWHRWYASAIRSRLEPVKRVARMIKMHLGGIINAVVRGVTNAGAEGINSVIQKVKYTARGFRNRERFRNAIYFHLGGLDLYPAAAAGGR